MLKAKNDLPNQRILTINLATAEMLFCWFRVVEWSAVIAGKNSDIFIILTMAFSVLTFTEIRLAMLHIIFDRFFEIFTNIKYPVYMTKPKMLMLIAIHWMISALCAMIGFVLQISISRKISFVFSFFLFLCLDIIVLIFGVITYIYFYLTVKKIKNSETISTNQRGRKTSLLIQKFKLPCYIVLTYILFNMTSTILLTLSENLDSEDMRKLLFHFSYVPILAGFISDAAIYTFGNRSVRKLLCSIFNRNTLQFPGKACELATIQTSDSLI